MKNNSSPNRAPAFMFYAKDHITTLAALQMDERGAWITLVNHCWWEGPIPVPLAVRLIGEKLLESIGFLLRIRGGNVTFDWMEEARAKQAHVSRIRSEVAKGHGRPRSRGASPKSNSFSIVHQSSNKKNPSRAGIANAKGITQVRKERARVAVRSFPFASIDANVAWQKFKEMRAAIRRPLTDAGAELFYDQLIAMGEADAIKALRQSTRKNYPDLYAPMAPRGAVAALPTDKAIVSGSELQRREEAAKRFHAEQAERERQRIAAKAVAAEPAPVELTPRRANDRIEALRARLSVK